MFILFYTIAVIASMTLLSIYLKDRLSMQSKIFLGITVYTTGHYGAKLLSYLESNNFSHFSFDEFITEKNGLTFYGGYLPIFVIIVFTIFYVSNTAIQFNKIFSIAIVIFHIGYIIGRLGCHLSADGCYGKVTFSNWGIRYTWGSYQTLFPVYPIPLFEIAINSFLCLFFSALISRKLYKFVIIQSLLLFPLSRFLWEYLRTNNIIKYGLTFNQLISIIIMVLLPIIYITLNKIKKYEKYPS